MAQNCTGLQNTTHKESYCSILGLVSLLLVYRCVLRYFKDEISKFGQNQPNLGQISIFLAHVYVCPSAGFYPKTKWGFNDFKF